MGDYKATVPVTLVTQKRNNIGGTSSEIVQLMGVRYAVMQEPTKGDKINEGIMKEIITTDPPYGAKVTVKGDHSGSGWCQKTFDPWLEKAI